MNFIKFKKIPRYRRNCVITEKIDGTNAQICITEDGEFLVGSRNRWISPEDDNYGFAKWAHENKEELLKLGVGYHFGEWWGKGIQRKYGMDHNVFSLFNAKKWSDEETRPKCCSVVPIIYEGMFCDNAVNTAMGILKNGSIAADGFDNPEGIVIFHKAGGYLFKKTFVDDEKPKSFDKTSK